jgi:surfactin synthase thioesterase subunit
MGGADDPQVPPARLADWSTLGRMAAPVRIFSGGHFYINDHYPSALALAFSSFF